MLSYLMRNGHVLDRVLTSRGLRAFFSREYIDMLAGCTPPRPRCFSLWWPEPPAAGETSGPVTDYACWPSLTDRSYFGRHLEPATHEYVRDLPANVRGEGKHGWGQVTELYAREQPVYDRRSSVLFTFFAQWLTDSVLRTNLADRRKNTSNHDIDLCQIYGLDEATARLLRAKRGGRLQSQRVGKEEYPVRLCEPDGKDGFVVRQAFDGLPYASKLNQLIAPFDESRLSHFYATGLERGNSSIGYVALSTLFLREHNRLARKLAYVCKWDEQSDDERLFQTARVINITQLLKIVVEEYVNHILGVNLFLLDHTFAETRNWYRANWISLEFNLLYRWHGLVPDKLTVVNTSYGPMQYRNNNQLFESVGIGAVLEAASREPAGQIGLRNTPTFLLEAEYNSLKMARDFRLQPFNEYRKRFGLRPVRNFEDLTRNADLARKLESLYGEKNIDKLEFLIGLFAEAPGPGRLFGELMTRMVAYDAFTHVFSNPLLSCNVFNEKTFTEYGLKQIEETTSLQTIVDRNVEVPPRVSMRV